METEAKVGYTSAVWGSNVFVGENMRSSALSCLHVTVFIFLSFDPCVSQKPCWEEKGQFIQDLWVAATGACKDDSVKGPRPEDADVTECGLGVCACGCRGSVGTNLQT